ncbi:hypothetical protein LTR53_001229 [Teratosphaeriaceae sp. CCFEE 6253]|nr:hypothetical protein LTR53_001229 [Teratosphaeriaceae sp. CCFEE 6253]
MAPIVHCVRHAQGYHNLCNANHAIHDPLLTPLGEEQCRTLAQKFPYHDNIDCVVASPLQRTINTAMLGFGQDLDKKGLKIIALPDLQETSDLPCDTGSDPSVLAKEYEGKPVDLSLVTPDWNGKKGRYSPSNAAVDARARDARLWLMARPEKEICLVTHGGFLHFFTEDWSDTGRFCGTGWANTEYRSYTFAPMDHESTTDANLTETQESRSRRKPAGAKPLDREEQAQLRATTEKEWQDQGYVAQGKAQEVIKAKV